MLWKIINKYELLTICCIMLKNKYIHKFHSTTFVGWGTSFTSTKAELFWVPISYIMSDEVISLLLVMLLSAIEFSYFKKDFKFTMMCQSCPDLCELLVSSPRCPYNGPILFSSVWHSGGRDVGIPSSARLLQQRNIFQTF